MKRDNKGFTLLEVLIAVMILALIAVPLLRSFASSYRVNARSRELMRATTLAQNEMEIFEKEKLEDLLDDEKYSYTVDDSTTYTTTDPTTGETMEHAAYTFTYDSGIINDETGREMFDVVVKMDPQVASASDLYYAQNTEKLLFMNTLSGADSGSYVQRVRNGVNTDGEDEEVYNLYVARQNPDSPTGSRLTAEHFASLLDRTITLKIEQTDQGGLVTTVAKVNYRYEFTPNNGEMPDEYAIYSPGDKVIFNNAQTLDEEGNPVELQSVYLFYAPRYDYAGNGVKEDKIVIENKQDLPVNVYIIRQNLQDPNSDDPDDKLGVYTDKNGIPKNTVPFQYRVNIEINEGLNEDGKTYGNYFTNLNLGAVGVTEHGTTGVTLIDSDNAGWSYTGNEAIDRAKFKTLGSTEAKDRIYTLTVTVYKHGADVENDEPLVELTGTKIE